QLAKQGLKLGSKAVAAGKASKDAAKAVSDVAPGVARAAEEVSAAAPAVERAVAQQVAEGAPPAVRAGAANVAAPSPAVRQALKGTATTSRTTFDRISSAAVPQLPKVSETISKHSGSIVDALTKTSRELDKAARTAKEVASEALPAPKKPSAK